MADRTRLLAATLALLSATSCDRAPSRNAPPGVPEAVTSAAASASAAPAGRAQVEPAEASCRRGTHRDLVYRRDEAQPVHRLDLTVPEVGTSLPLVVYVHGGAFKEGSRAEVHHKPAFFRREGFVFASVDYRLSTPGSGVQSPMHVEDVAAAIGWLEDHAAEYCVDRRKMVAMGHSAGGHLVAAIGADVRHLRRAGASPRALRCVMVNDSEGFDLPRLFARRKSGFMRETYEGAFGSDEAVLRDASPIHHVGEHPDLPHFLLITRGSEERKAQVTAFAREVRAAGGTAFIVDADPRDHLAIDRGLGAPGDDLGPTTVRFYRRCLGMDPSGSPR